MCLYFCPGYKHEYIALVAAQLLRVCLAVSVRQCGAVVQIHCAVAARSASELLRDCCTPAARVAHVHAHENQHENLQFLSNQVRST